MERKLRKQIEYYFYNYEKIKKEAAQYISDLCAVSSPILENLGRGSGISNITEAKGIKLAEYNKYLWCEVVEKTYLTYRWTFEGIILQHRYFKKERHEKTCMSIGCEPSTYYYNLNRALGTAEMWAKEYRLL